MTDTPNNQPSPSHDTAHPRVELLISCMGLKDYRILEMTHIQSDALIIDQCAEDSLSEFSYRGHRIRHLKCTERGLSRSRNKALANSAGEIGYLLDDDVTLINGYPDLIARAYQEIPDADVICFLIENKPRKLKPKKQRVNKFTSLNIASWQISLNIAAVRKAGVTFDVLMGAGTGNGAGEEAKFLQDCIAAGLNVYYVPYNIGRIGDYKLDSDKEGYSTWFTGINDAYFYQRGATTRYMLGLPVAVVYALYYVPTHRAFIEQSMSRSEAFRHIMRGVLDNPIGKQARNR